MPSAGLAPRLPTITAYRSPSSDATIAPAPAHDTSVPAIVIVLG